MKLPSFQFLEELEKIKENIGAEDKKITLTPLSELDPTHLELIKLEDWKEKVGHGPKGELIDKKTKEIIVVYIRDNGYHHQDSPDEVLKKVHITWCSTLRDMKENDRYERYIAHKSPNDSYPIDVRESDNSSRKVPVERRLWVCRNCLGETNFNGFTNLPQSKKKQFLQDFKMQSWFDYCHNHGGGTPFSGTNQPRHTSDNAPSSDYTSDWDSVARRYKESKNWKCEQCGLDCSNNKSNLDCHHKNGVKSNNNPLNLKALCKNCHAQQPHHSHYNP